MRLLPSSTNCPRTSAGSCRKHIGILVGALLLLTGCSTAPIPPAVRDVMKPGYPVQDISGVYLGEDSGFSSSLEPDEFGLSFGRAIPVSLRLLDERRLEIIRVGSPEFRREYAVHESSMEGSVELPGFWDKREGEAGRTWVEVTLIKGSDGNLYANRREIRGLGPLFLVPSTKRYVSYWRRFIPVESDR